MAAIKINFYFCNVKLHKRYMSAAISSVFCALNLLFNRYIRILVCGRSNAHEVFACVNLTAPSAVFCLTSK